MTYGLRVSQPAHVVTPLMSKQRQIAHEGICNLPHRGQGISQEVEVVVVIVVVVVVPVPAGVAGPEPPPHPATRPPETSARTKAKPLGERIVIMYVSSARRGERSTPCGPANDDGVGTPTLGASLVLAGRSDEEGL